MDIELAIEQGINHLSNNDQTLNFLIEKYPKFNLRPHNNFFQDIVASIIMQQLSMKAGTAIFNKFANYFNQNITPKEILSEPIENLRKLGISQQKITYLKDLSQKIVNDEIKIANIDKLSNQDIIDNLTKVKGIGIWTVQMFLIFTLCRLDILPTKDLGIRKAVGKLYLNKDIATEKDVHFICEKYNWQPYASIASWYLWRSLENT